LTELENPAFVYNFVNRFFFYLHPTMKKILALFILLMPVLTSQAQMDSLFVITSDSARIFVQRSGTGYPVLFVHGGPGSHSGYFQYCGGDVFSKDVQLIYMDQRGCGRSPAPANGNYAPGRMSLDFEEVRKALGIRKWILMPHSFGAILATEYAAKYPEAVQAMVYLNGTINIDHSARSGLKKTIDILKARGVNVSDLEQDSIPLMKRWGAGFGKLQELGIFHTMMFDTKENFDYHDSVTQAIAKYYGFGQAVWNYPAYFQDHAPLTAKIKAPVLVISGTRDYTIGLDHPKLMKFPHMEIKYVTGGHALYMEHTQELYEAVYSFLEKYAR
jgi:proline iminopeptidase